MTADQIIRGLHDIDVLVVPDGYSNYAHAGAWLQGQACPASLGGRRRPLRRVAGRHPRRHQAPGLSSATALRDTTPTHPARSIRTTLDADSPLGDGGREHRLGDVRQQRHDDAAAYAVGEFPAPGSSGLRHVGARRDASAQLAGTGDRRRRAARRGSRRHLLDRPELPRLDARHPPAAVERHHRTGPRQPSAARLAPVERRASARPGAGGRARTPEMGDADADRRPAGSGIGRARGAASARRLQVVHRSDGRPAHHHGRQRRAPGPGGEPAAVAGHSPASRTQGSRSRGPTCPGP